MKECLVSVWEQRKLSNVVDSVDTGKSKFDKEGSSGEYPILGSTSVIGYDDEYDYEGDFILTARVGANAGSLYRHAGKVKISDNTVFIQASQNIEFLYQLLTRFDIKKLSFGTGQPLVKASELKSLELMMPTNMKEQMRIGAYFNHLDHLITLHQRKHLDLLKIRKNTWEQRKLGDVSESYSGGTPSVGNKSYYGGSIPFIRSAEINSESTELFLTEEGLTNSSARMVYKGDILYALYGATSGETGRSRINGAINQAILAILPHDGYDSEFLMQWLRKSKQNITDVYLQGGQGNLSGAIVKALDVNFPSLAEQWQIGNYFQSIDHLITLHQRKCDEAKKLKKFMLQKMFPQNGSRVPEIRFDGFTDDWEQRKLSEIAIRVTEKNKNNEFTEPFTNSAELGIISQKEYFEREIVNDENLDGYYIVRKDDFVYNPRISGTAPVGPINRNRLERNGVMSPLYTVFRVHDIADLYLEYYFKTTNWHRFMKLNGDSGARFDRFTISSTQFMEMPIPYPEVEEQKKIGAYFEHIDHLITLHQQKCDDLKNLKKYMLQNMFV